MTDATSPTMDSQSPQKHAAPLSSKRLLRSLLTVMIGFAATKLISLVQVFIIADRFDVGAEYDTFAIGNNVTTQLIRILGAGAITVAFIPVFSGLLNRETPQVAWRLASQVFNTLLVFTIGVGTIVALTAPWLVKYILAPGFDVEQIAQTATLIRILLLSVVIFSLSSLFTGVLHGHNHFLLPVLAPIFYDMGLLFGVIFFTGPWGVYGLAWGTVLGALMHFSIQLPGLFIFGAKWYPLLGWRDSQLRSVVRLMIPRMGSSVIFAINIVAIGNIASRLGEGAPSAFEWGIRIMDIPEALIGTAMGLVLLPTLSALSELGKRDERLQIFSEAIRFVAVATIPAAIGMILIGKPALYILFPEETALVAESPSTDTVEAEIEESENADDNTNAGLVYAVVQILAFAVVFQSLHEIITRAFYAEKDTWLPLIASFWGMVANLVVLGIGFYAYDTLDNIPLVGPFGAGITAIGYTMSFLIELVFLTVVLRRRWHNIDAPRITETITRTLLATLIMAIPIFGVDYFMAHNVFTEGSRFAGLVRAIIGGFLGIVVFTGAALFLNLKEIKQLPVMLRRTRQVKAESST